MSKYDPIYVMFSLILIRNMTDTYDTILSSTKNQQ